MENTPKLVAMMVMGLYLTLAAASPTNSIAACDRALEDQNLPHQSDCSKYYRCVYGKKVPKECPEKMLFNPLIGNCDLYYNVECPQEKISDDDIQESQQHSAEAFEKLAGRNFVRNPKVSELATPEFFNSAEHSGETSTKKFVYVPHERDQNAYYRVQNGEKLLLYCEEGKMFSIDMEICAKVK